MTQTMMALGTAYYMAPEQLQGLADIDGRADQYAVAVMLYEMFTGQIPTGRIESLTKVRKDVPRAASFAVDKALSPKREQRYPSMDDFRLGLRGKGAGLSGKTVLTVGGGLALTGLIAAAMMTFPQWKDLLPDKEKQSALQQEVARLDGEARSLQKRVDESRREVDTAASNAKREVDRMESQLNTVFGEAEKRARELSLWEARNKLVAAEFVARGFRDALEGQEGLVIAEGKLRAAEAAQKNGQLEQAKSLLEDVQKKRLPDTQRNPGKAGVRAAASTRAMGRTAQRQVGGRRL